MEKIRNLHITLEKSDETNAPFPLKNKMQLTYNGLNLYFDDQKPAYATKTRTNQSESLRLTDWKKNEDSFELYFTNDVVLRLSLSDEGADSAADSDSTFFASVSLPDQYSALYLPFKFASNMKILSTEGNQTILSGKKRVWELNVPSTMERTIGFTAKNPRLSYTIHDETRKFSFETIAELASASQTMFFDVRNAIKTNLISTFKANTNEANLSEQIAVSYVAAQAENGSYNSAIEDVPQSIKKSKTRTYLSTPYFNNLEDMNNILDTYISSTELQIAKAASTASLDIFTVRNIANFLCISKNLSAVTQILKNAGAAEKSQLSLSQAGGILQAYIDLTSLNMEYANILLPVLENCSERIEEACSFDGTNLTISENDTFISVIQACELGTALIRYGMISENSLYEKAGFVIVNSYLGGSSSFDLRTLANIYPVLFYENSYYPHFEKINVTDSEWIWAWTCAKDIRYKREGKGPLTLSIDFPASSTHYLILKGIPRFSQIFIYGISFRTDARFENYNSSGYVYKTDSKTLLLKSRHKADTEEIRLEFAAPKPAPLPEVKPDIIDISPESVQTPAAGESTPSSAEIPEEENSDLENPESEN